MSLIAQYYECSVGIYNNVDCCKKKKKKKNIRNGQRDVTVKHTEK